MGKSEFTGKPEFPGCDLIQQEITGKPEFTGCNLLQQEITGFMGRDLIQQEITGKPEFMGCDLLQREIMGNIYMSTGIHRGSPISELGATVKITNSNIIIKISHNGNLIQLRKITLYLAT